MTVEQKLNDPLFINRCRNLDLDPIQIQKHIRKIANAIKNQTEANIPILDTCRLDNTGIIASSCCPIGNESSKGVASFIPAAGASSRYYKPFGDLVKILESNDLALIKSSLLKLIKQGANQWPLPNTLRKFVEKPDQEMSEKDIELIILELSLPKALQPCVITGQTFLEMKILEDRAFQFLEGSFLVTSPTMETAIQKKLNSLDATNFKILLQGPKQSTVRVKQNLEPLIEDEALSIVPAGHGTLAELFPKVREYCPYAHSVLIRNIDNIVGPSSEVVDHTANLVKTHNFLRNNVANIRHSIDEHDFKEAEKIAANTLKFLPTSKNAQLDHNSESRNWTEAKEKYPYSLKLQQDIFHLNCDLFSYTLKEEKHIEATIKRLYDRPVNTMGMVPNTQNNIGGSPVFVNFHNLPIKLCIELPHVSSEDREKYLVPPEKATHFNPVFVVSEIPKTSDYYSQFEESSWVLAKKSYKGQEVYYHESVLYELISDSLLSNCAFVEIPLLLFNPHKSITDSVGKKFTDWNRL